MDAINQENILKRNKKIIQQGLRGLGLVVFLLFLGVSCSDSTSSGGGGNNSDIQDLVNTAEFNYDTLDYGKVTLRGGISNPIYAIANSTAPNDEIKVNRSGVITVVEGLAAGEYTFQVVVTDRNDNENFYIIEGLTVTINSISITPSDFTISPNSVTKEIGYRDENYGSITANDRQTATFSIVNSNAPDNTIAIDENGVITVGLGLGIRTYTFQVEVNGTGSYIGSFTLDFTLIVDKVVITEEGFTISPVNRSVTYDVDYRTNTFGSIVAKDGQTATFKIINSNAPDNTIAIDENGVITVGPGLGIRTYNFQVEVIGTGSYIGGFTVGFEIVINSIEITPSDFTVSTTNVIKVAGYRDENYGSITANDRQTATFSIVNSNAPDNTIAIDENGVITVGPGLGVGTYTFSVQVDSAGNYDGSFTIDNLQLVVNTQRITEGDFTISTKSVTNEIGYRDTSYGSITANSGQTVTYALSNSPSQISINSAGVITVALGLAAGTYNFSVQVNSAGSYTGSFNVDLELFVFIPIEAGDVNFNFPSPTSQILPIRYSPFTYGTVTLNGGVTADFAINVIASTGATVSPDIIEIDANGNITVGNGLIHSTTYTFQVQVTGNGNYFGIVTSDNIEITIETVSFFNNVANISDDESANPPIYLSGAVAVTTAVIDGTTYLFTGVQGDGALTVHSINSVDNRLVSIFIKSIGDNFGDMGTNAGLRAVATTKIGNTTYIFQAIANANLVKVYSFPDGGDLTSLDDKDIRDNATLLLQSPRGLTTAELNGKYYLFVASSGENGVQVFEVATDGTLTPAARIADNNTLALQGARDVTTAVVDNRPYLFVAGFLDNGLSVFSMDNTSGTLILENRDNVRHIDNTLFLTGVTKITTTVLDGTIYLVAIGETNNGFSVLAINSNGSLRNDYSTTFPNYVDKPADITFTEISGRLYFFVSASRHNSVTMFEMDKDAVGSLSFLRRFTSEDDNIRKLGAPQGITITKINGVNYLFVASYSDEGVGVFRIDNP